MPNYEYACGDCGPFNAWRPMAESDLPTPCPECAAPAPRSMAAPRLGAGAAASPPPATGASSMRIHGGGCACCAPRAAPRVASPA
ncbi:MAG TPA: FmdB family zinc ribbon protein [Hyphomicrobiales bacterium]|nr:FmdB family zinc ribbon protein [Hyphomicrobiales bacterium]